MLGLTVRRGLGVGDGAVERSVAHTELIEFLKAVFTVALDFRSYGGDAGRPKLAGCVAAAGRKFGAGGRNRACITSRHRRGFCFNGSSASKQR